MTSRFKQYIFGHDITRVFYPMQGEDPVQLPTQTLAIYLFDEKPDEADAILGTGKIADGTQSAQSATAPYHFTYSFPAIDVPDDLDSSGVKLYWEAIVYIAKTAGESICLIRSLKVSLLESLDSIPGTTAADLKEAFPSLSNYLADSEITALIELAEAELKLYFRSKGILWQRIYDNEDLELVLAYKAISDAAFTQIMNQNDRHHLRHELFAKKYSDLLNLITIKYDPTNSGQITTNAEAKTSVAVMRR